MLSIYNLIISAECSNFFSS